LVIFEQNKLFYFEKTAVISFVFIRAIISKEIVFLIDFDGKKKKKKKKFVVFLY
jgi:hypothetical protein